MEQLGQRKSGFQFENMWVEKQDCEKIIQDIWKSGQGNIEIQITDRVSSCGEALMRWSKGCFGNVKEYIYKKKL